MSTLRTVTNWVKRETEDDREQERLKQCFDREYDEYEKTAYEANKQKYLTPSMMKKMNECAENLALLRKTYRGFDPWFHNEFKTREWTEHDTKNHPHVKYALANHLYSMADIMAAVNDKLDILDEPLDQFLRSMWMACDRVDEMLEVTYGKLLDALKVETECGLTPSLLNVINERCVEMKALVDKYHNCGKWKWFATMKPREWTVEDSRNHRNVKYALDKNLYTLEGMLAVIDRKPKILDEPLDQFIDTMRVVRGGDNTMQS